MNIDCIESVTITVRGGTKPREAALAALAAAELLDVKDISFWHNGIRYHVELSWKEAEFNAR